MRVIRTDKAPAPVEGAPYSQAMAAPAAGEIVYLAGQVPLVPGESTLTADGIADQTRQVMDNLIAVLAEAGGTPENIIKTTIYLTDLSHFGEMNTVYGEALGGHAPARATVEVSGLPLGALVEIEAVAVIGS